MSGLTLSTVLRRSTDVLFTTLGEEVVMMSPERGAYFTMNAVASSIWERLSEPMSIALLCAELQAEFDVSPERCEAEVLSFAHRLQAAGLVAQDGG